MGKREEEEKFSFGKLLLLRNSTVSIVTKHTERNRLSWAQALMQGIEVV